MPVETAARIEDPGIRALFEPESRWQAWLDVEVALARAEAELGIIPEESASEIARKAKIELIDLDAVREGLDRTGHSLVPLIWELDRICEGDAGGRGHGAVHHGGVLQRHERSGAARHGGAARVRDGGGHPRDHRGRRPRTKTWTDRHLHSC